MARCLPRYYRGDKVLAKEGRNILYERRGPSAVRLYLIDLQFVRGCLRESQWESAGSRSAVGKCCQLRDKASLRSN